MHRYAQRATARYEAFSWYFGDPPSPSAAKWHFVEKADREPANRALYAEALEIFLETCWKIPAPSREPFANHRVRS